MKAVFLQGLIIILTIFLPGCISYKTKNVDHNLYALIPKNRANIRWYDFGHWTTWALFGNDDDGIFGEKAHYKPEEPKTLSKACCWYLRNPLHNFCFYVIGSASHRNSAFTLLKITSSGITALHYHPEGHTVFPCKKSCFYLALHGWKPFMALRLDYAGRRRSDFYAGWRERGNFGLKCVLLTKSSSD